MNVTAESTFDAAKPTAHSREPDEIRGRHSMSLHLRSKGRAEVSSMVRNV